MEYAAMLEQAFRQTKIQDRIQCTKYAVLDSSFGYWLKGLSTSEGKELFAGIVVNSGFITGVELRNDKHEIIDRKDFDTKRLLDNFKQTVDELAVLSLASERAVSTATWELKHKGVNPPVFCSKSRVIGKVDSVLVTTRFSGIWCKLLLYKTGNSMSIGLFGETNQTNNTPGLEANFDNASDANKCYQLLLKGRFTSKKGKVILKINADLLAKYFSYVSLNKT